VKARRSLVPVLALLFGGCSNQPSSSSGVPGDIQYSLSVHLPAGAEQFQCQYVTTPAMPRFMIAAAHKYTPGSHHMLLYRTDLTTIPAGQTGVQDCYEGGGGTIMSHVRGVVYGSQVPSDSYALPDGIAMPLAGKEVLLLQAHYINATPHAVDASVNVGLTTHSDMTKVRYNAGNLFYYDVFIHVPAMAKATAGERCTLDHDITLLNAFAHYHSRGYGYQAFMDMPNEPAATAPFYTSTDWEHPAKYTGGPMQLKAGTAIRWTCDYQNDTAQEFYQGPSAAKNEMCMFTGLYYPAVDNAFEECLSSFDSFGQGTATCGDTTSCIGACPAATAPAGGGQGNIPDCWQKCVVASCPAVGKQLLEELRCFGTNCGSCAATGDCQQCVVQKCASQIAACTAAKCG
jgi:hypothetical protein